MLILFLIKKMKPFTKPILFSMVLVLAVSSIHSISAQSDIENTTNEQGLAQLDNTLTPQISATLAGLSLTGGTFLVNFTRINENINNNIHVARKSFIKAFFMFLICTIVLFVFDSLEIVDIKNVIVYVFFDVFISYALFAIGSMYLIKAAKPLYSIYGKN
jgi:hypothetical protein